MCIEMKIQIDSNEEYLETSPTGMCIEIEDS